MNKNHIFRDEWEKDLYRHIFQGYRLELTISEKEVQRDIKIVTHINYVIVNFSSIFLIPKGICRMLVVIIHIVYRH